ncbi:MAG TPA: MBOAT family protein [Gemmataceae bacterium]|nr:MBOAT family protein [Gemmataceae bacterium]
MLFPTSQFLGFFLIVFTVYWLLGRHRWRMLWLTAASTYFYMAWSPWFILLILGSTSIDYLVAMRLNRVARDRTRQAMVALSVCVNLGILAYFKYAAFALDSARELTHWLGWSVPIPTAKAFLPLGISFYTFEAISYVVDVYRGRTTPVRNPLDYALYILFFPHLVAGPIVRAHDFLPQLERPKRFGWPRFQSGAQLFLIGLFKKSVIADQVAQAIDPVFADPARFGSTALWLAVLGYAIQIYCDFSGYTDMALGLAHTLGFKLPNNFNAPYLATSPADFWRRWHISLSRWLRDYLYIPLGGNRKGPVRTMINLFVTMLLGGLWHGANWTFVIWGAYHGLLLAIQRLIPAGWDRPALRPVTTLMTFLLVCIGWVFFRAQTLADAGQILRGLVVPTDGLGLAGDGSQLVLACVIVVLIGQAVGQIGGSARWLFRVPAPVAGAILALLMTLALLLMPGDGKVFIYFQF